MKKKKLNVNNKRGSMYQNKRDRNVYENNKVLLFCIDLTYLLKLKKNILLFVKQSFKVNSK